jgi:hypothetical protein
MLFTPSADVQLGIKFSYHTQFHVLRPQYGSHCSIAMRTANQMSNDLEKSHCTYPLTSTSICFMILWGLVWLRSINVQLLFQVISLVYCRVPIASSGAQHGYSVQNTATFTVRVNERFKVSVVDAEQSSHLFTRL